MASPSSTPINFEVAIQKIVREEWGYLVSSLISSLRDLNLAEDVLQDAVEAALLNWKKDGLPKSPKGWLLKTAKRKAIDRIRRDKNFKSKTNDITLLSEPSGLPKEDEFTVPDERLRLIFTCCHPALDHKISVALTLQLLGGLSTAEIARAFLVKTETMAQRLVRGKRKIKQSGIPYIIPEKEIFAERLDAVLSVLYLIFNEGYSATSRRKHIRIELCQEAIRLCNILHKLCPNEAEVKALLSLMLLHDARRIARFNRKGDFISLEKQDRSLWLVPQIDAGLLLIENALKMGKVGSYQVQAAISAIHSEAKTFDQTNWQEISLLYDELYKINATPVVQLNRLVAKSYITSVNETLVALNELEHSFKDYQPFYAVKADFLKRSGDLIGAENSYLQAIRLSGNTKEREFLERSLNEMLA